MTEREVIESWKAWHRELASALKLSIVERNVTLAAVKALASRDGVVVAEGVWDEFGGYVADDNLIPIVDCHKIVDGTAAFNGRRVRVIVKPIREGGEG